jgi:hypothetical protein
MADFHRSRESSPRPAARGMSPAIVVVGLLGCTGAVGDPGPENTPGPEAISGAGLRILTPTQFGNSVRELLGDDVPVDEVGQWRSSIAAAQGSIAPDFAGRYETAALAAADFVFADPARRSALVGCEPTLAEADACVREFLGRFGRRAWRRSLTEIEITRYATRVASIGASFSDPWRGLSFAVAGLLQSPYFLYRVELGEPDAIDPGRIRFTGYEMATRIAYLTTSSPPDDALLGAAEAGMLDDAGGVRAEVERLLATDAGARGLESLAVDLFDLDAIPALEKDVTLFPLFTPAAARAMRDQLALTFRTTGNYRDLFTSRSTFMNADLAPIYGVTGEFGAELVPFDFPADSGRAGFLSLAGLNAYHSYQGKTSVTLRGLFVRRNLLCQTIPPPPPGVSTVLRDVAPGEMITTRDLVAEHEMPGCVACHGLMDPIGLPLESYDAIGQFRDTQNGIAIDTTGSLDGVDFADAEGLGRALADHDALAPCFVRNLHAYASGHTTLPDEEAAIAAVAEAVIENGYDLRSAVISVATSDAFRYGGRTE